MRQLPISLKDASHSDRDELACRVIPFKPDGMDLVPQGAESPTYVKLLTAANCNLHSLG